MDIAKEAVREMIHGHATVGTTRVQLTEFDFTGYKGVLIRAPGVNDPSSGNTAPVWVGGKGVTADSTATGGMPVTPGSSLFIPIDKPDQLWLISTAADQDIAWMVV